MFRDAIAFIYLRIPSKSILFNKKIIKQLIVIISYPTDLWNKFDTIDIDESVDNHNERRLLWIGNFLKETSSK